MTRMPSSTIHDYDFLDQIGVGSFGCVYRAKHKATNSTVAVKVMKKKSGKSTESNHWHEYKTMKRLSAHPNVVHLYEGFTGPTKILYFVMEFMNGGNLYQYLEKRRDLGEKLNEGEIRLIVRQTLNALESIHSQGYFHRDLKPENLLVNTSPDEPAQLTIKLADFGLARELKSKAPYTDYVSTRWYRSPEVLLKASVYSSSVDIWAVGVIMAELLTLHPLFPGQSEIDQLFKICEIIGSPGSNVAIKKKNKIRNNGFSRKKSDMALSTPATNVSPPSSNAVPDKPSCFLGDGGEWKEGVKLAHKLGFQFPQVEPKGLVMALPFGSKLMVDLIRRLLLFDPTKRLCASDALGHPFFIDILQTTPNRPISEQLQTPTKTTTPRTVSMVDIKETLPSSSAHAASFMDPLSFYPLSLAMESNMSNFGERLNSEFYTLIGNHNENDKLAVDSGPHSDIRHRHSTSVMNTQVTERLTTLNDIVDTVDQTMGDNANKSNSDSNDVELHISMDGDDHSTNLTSANQSSLQTLDNSTSPQRHNRHDSFDLLVGLDTSPIPLNLRPSFSSPLNHLDHLNQRRQNQKQQSHFAAMPKSTTATAASEKKKTSTGFTHFFGLRKKIRQPSSSNLRAISKNTPVKSAPSVPQDRPTKKPATSSDTSAKSVDPISSGIPRTESFPSFILKQIASTSTSIRPALNVTNTKKVVSGQQSTEHINQQHEHRPKSFQRRSPSIPLLSTYYDGSNTKEKTGGSKSFWSRKHTQQIDDTPMNTSYTSNLHFTASTTLPAILK